MTAHGEGTVQTVYFEKDVEKVVTAFLTVIEKT